VSFSPALRWFVAFLLVLTVGLKWATSNVGPTITAQAEGQFGERGVSQFLVRNQFRITESREVVFGMQLLVAEAPFCQLKVVLSSSRGWHRDLIQNLTKGSANSFVVFGGKIYREQPIWLTVSDFLWARALNGLGFKANFMPVITVIEKQNCGAENLPWTEVSFLAG